MRLVSLCVKNMTITLKRFTLCDTSPLIALIDKSDVSHKICLNAIRTLPSPLLTTWPCFTEAMYLLGSRLGYKAQETLWAFVSKNRLLFYNLNDVDIVRTENLMKKYRDRPMDFADASLVAAAESVTSSRR